MADDAEDGDGMDDGVAAAVKIIEATKHDVMRFFIESLSLSSLGALRFVQ